MIRRLFFLVAAIVAHQVSGQAHKAPAYPLITHDPYFSVWSFSDKLNETTTKHWTGKNMAMVGLLKVNGVTYSFLGAPEPTTKEIAPTAEAIPQPAQVTFDKPADDWMMPAFADGSWQTSLLPMSSEQKNWTTRDVWVRKYFDYSNSDALNRLLLRVRHDDDIEVYINGEKAYGCGPCYKGGYDNILLADAVKAKLKPGRNVLAFHCTNTGGPGFVDAGLLNEIPNNLVQSAIQTRLEITATQTKYHFTCGPINMEVTFISPLVVEAPSLLPARFLI
jgi:hypothetical protein